MFFTCQINPIPCPQHPVYIPWPSQSMVTFFKYHYWEHSTSIVCSKIMFLFFLIQIIFLGIVLSHNQECGMFEELCI